MKKYLFIASLGYVCYHVYSQFVDPIVAKKAYVKPTQNAENVSD